MKPGSIIFNPILRLKKRFGFHLRATDLSLRAVANRMLYAIFFVSKCSSVNGKFYRDSVLTQLVDFYQKHKTSNRMLYAIFFVSKGSSVNGKFYRDSVLTQLVDFYQKRRPRTGVRGIKLLHDNTPAHKSTTVQKYLKESWLDVLGHPPYSPDLSPCDFWLFPRLKEMLAGHGFESRCGIGSAVYQRRQHIPKEDYLASFRKWVDLCKMCVEADRAYFEGLR